MTVDVKQLKEEIKTYNDLIEEYEGNYLNYYNVLSSFSFYWKDNHAKKFYDSLPREKLNCKNLISELKSIQEVYKYISYKYSEFGDHISINLKNKDYVLRKFDTYLEKADRIIHKYSNLDLSFCPTEASLIRKERDSILTCKNSIKEKKDSVRDCFNKIENIEKEVRYRINRISTVSIRETDIRGMY